MKSNIGFGWEKKTGVTGQKNLSEQSREPTNQAQVGRRVTESNRAILMESEWGLL